MSWGQTDTHGGGDQWVGGDDTGAGYNAADFDGGNDGFGAGDHEGADRPRGACYNCGEEGHNKADCPNPRVEREFTGECRTCGKEGHRAVDCPDRPPQMCNNCGQEGHMVAECQNARVIDRSNVRDVEGVVAWDKMVEAAKIRDMDDVKEGFQEYVKASPDLTYLDVEKGFRDQDAGIYIIAIEKPQLIGALTNMDLQGNLGKKYTITFRFDNKPLRERERQFFPKDAAENLERLSDAGEPVDSRKMKCSNCSEYGHISKNCPEDKVEKEQAVVKCFHCGEEGHRVRDCPQPRVDKFACKNCQQPGHKASDCPEPPNPANVDCRKCGEKGHFSRDCPQGGGGGGACHNCGQEGHRARDCTEEKKIICRNCDAEGHTGRECPKPRDYSRVKCSNCGEMGHTKVRCKQPVPTEDADGDAGDSFGGASEAMNDFAAGDQNTGDFGANQMGHGYVEGPTAGDW
ncbi:hypothetical protein PFICI_07216 [Pestalotiopsis fici W106-1]|uniref:CCHC-type domain-containing protein n=1 Tax=Pestalotiopsis fici (strain W106-1 / CGMCC3.15140) TaxID=1229662 RepID=W3X865_PESFW|nr:uncharacterized protein PFICI_07216 [Pestalotiopsis fici W106-1]ETS82214.1 hypothetical protein PFICI_07216 [Pestalotiopsis fici W106-1]